MNRRIENNRKINKMKKLIKRKVKKLRKL